MTSATDAAGRPAAAERAGWGAGRAALAVLACVLFALSFGLRYLVHNQHTYLLHGLHRWDPTLFSRDWLVQRTTDYHPLFSVLVAAFAATGALPWVMALADVLVLAAAAFVLIRLVDAVAGENAVPVSALLLGLLALWDHKDVVASVADSALFTNYLVPANLGALGLIVGVERLLRGRVPASGIAIALGGAFHLNYAVLAFPVLGLAHLLQGRERLAARLAAQLGPSAVVVLVRLPALLAMAGDPNGAAARMVFLTIRSPHHYVPATFASDFVPFFGWHVLGLSALRLLRGERPAHRVFTGLLASLFLLITVATLLTTAVYVPSVAQLYFWRLAPLSVLLAQVALLAAVVERTRGRLPLPRRAALAALVPLAVGLTAVGLSGEPRHRAALAAIALLAAGGGVFARYIPGVLRTRPAPVATAVGAALFAIGVPQGIEGMGREAAFLSDPVAGTAPVCRWARRQARDALFVVPPGFQEFRLCAERSVVVDWKSTPILPSQLLEWYRRIGLVTGIENVRTLDAAEKGYFHMGPRRMERLRGELGADFVVFRQPFPRARLREFPVAWADRHFIAFRLQRGAARP